jgi:hypothetical protein
MVGLILFGITMVGLISWLWVKGIDYMKENYPNYEGEDFFNEEDKNEIL